METRFIDEQARKDETLYAMFIHLSYLTTYMIALPILVTLILWLVKKDESEFLDDHGREAINFQISLLILTVICFALFICGIGPFLLMGIPILGVVGCIMGAVAARRGEYFRYPMTFRIISSRAGS
ncbi:MAG: DUF4870 domain-containing protein [Phycisphaerales bacterium]|nr:DUF4870 domain-containing protein [Phycisphaerales bacterium]